MALLDYCSALALYHRAIHSGLCCYLPCYWCGRLGHWLCMRTWYRVAAGGICSSHTLLYLPGSSAAKRLFHIDREKVATNASAMVGRRGKVCVEVNDDDGRVMIDGVDWKAVSLTGERIEQGALVEVVAIDSVILTVKRI